MLRRLPQYSRPLDDSISRSAWGSFPRRLRRRALVVACVVLAVGADAIPPTKGVRKESQAPDSPDDPSLPLWTQATQLDAPEDSPVALSLEDALARARSFNPDLLLADIAVERQKAVQAQYRGQLMPRVNVSASFDHRDDTLKDVSTGLASGSIVNQRLSQNDTSRDARIEARQTVFSGFTLFNRYRQQVLRTRGGQVSREDVRQRIESMVKQNFASVLYRRQVLATREESVSVFTQTFEIATAKEKVGETTALDLLRAQTELHSAEAQLIEARTDLVQSEQAFRRLLRLPLPSAPETERLQLAGTLEERQFQLSLEDTRRRALGLRQDYAAAKLQRDASKLGVMAARGAYAPTIDVFANYGWRSSYYANNPDLLKGWTVGFAATMNIFDGLSRRGAIGAEMADARSADLKLEDLKYQILSQLGELFATLQQSRSALSLHRAAVDLSVRGLEQASRMYKIGQIDLEELINAQLALQRSRLNLARALLENNVAIAQLEYAGGEWPQ